MDDHAGMCLPYGQWGSTATDFISGAFLTRTLSILLSAGTMKDVEPKFMWMMRTHVQRTVTRFRRLTSTTTDTSTSTEGHSPDAGSRADPLMP